MKDIISTLDDWCQGCDGMLSCLATLAEKANAEKKKSVEHRNQVEKRVSDLGGGVKVRQVKGHKVFYLPANAS